jgi:hypothetical protein
VMRRTRSFSRALKNTIHKAYCKSNQSLGDWSDGGTPGYIPNPVVKPVSADGTWGATPWESRSLPRDFFLEFWSPRSLDRGSRGW